MAASTTYVLQWGYFTGWRYIQIHSIRIFSSDLRGVSFQDIEVQVFEGWNCKRGQAKFSWFTKIYLEIEKEI